MQVCSDDTSSNLLTLLQKREINFKKKLVNHMGVFNFITIQQNV